MLSMLAVLFVLSVLSVLSKLSVLSVHTLPLARNSADAAGFRGQAMIRPPSEGPERAPRGPSRESKRVSRGASAPVDSLEKGLRPRQQ